jgi:hypothetical protein
MEAEFKPPSEKSILDAISHWGFPPPPGGKEPYAYHLFSFRKRNWKSSPV